MFNDMIKLSVLMLLLSVNGYIIKTDFKHPKVECFTGGLEISCRGFSKISWFLERILIENIEVKKSSKKWCS